MKPTDNLKTPATLAALTFAGFSLAFPAEAPAQPSKPAGVENAQQLPYTSPLSNSTADQLWNWHAQNTYIVQYHPAFPADYSGPNSFNNHSEVNETISLDIMAGVRTWHGAELHADALIWQGSGLSHTVGIEGFPNGEAFRVGSGVPNINLARFFLRQTIGFGGDQQEIADDAFHLARKEDISNITLTIGKISLKDIFDDNAYANDPRTQFMSWAFMANEAWDFPGDALGYTTGLAAELNQPQWTARYGFFQMPKFSNSVDMDKNYLNAWGMVTEFEYRLPNTNHPGTVRLLAYLNRANMGSYQEAINSPIRPADITATRAYRYKFGFGINLDQEITDALGAFARLGWSDGRSEAWVFSDADQTANAGLSLKGKFWHRADDTLGVAAALNLASGVHRDFLAAGGTGILAGDGRLTYGIEQLIETYYDFALCKYAHAALDYQYVENPAFNRDRGPIHIFGARLHWEF